MRKIKEIGARILKDVRSYGLGLFMAAVYVLAGYLLGISLCPMVRLTGLPCPGCGMTRAWLSLLLGRPLRALHYHPLVWLPPVALAIYLFRGKLPRQTVRSSLAALGALFCIVYLIRLFTGCAPDVVAFAPKKGLLFRLGAVVLAQT